MLVLTMEEVVEGFIMNVNVFHTHLIDKNNQILERSIKAVQANHCNTLLIICFHSQIC